MFTLWTLTDEQGGKDTNPKDRDLYVMCMWTCKDIMQSYITFSSLSVLAVPLLTRDFWRVRGMCRSLSPASGVCGADEWCCCCWMVLIMLLLLCCSMLGSTDNWRMLGCDRVLCGPSFCWLWLPRVVFRRTGFGVGLPDSRMLLKLDSLLLVLPWTGATSVGFFCCGFALAVALLPAGQHVMWVYTFLPCKLKFFLEEASGLFSKYIFAELVR